MRAYQRGGDLFVVDPDKVAVGRSCARSSRRSSAGSATRSPATSSANIRWRCATPTRTRSSRTWRRHSSSPLGEGEPATAGGRWRGCARLSASPSTTVDRAGERPPSARWSPSCEIAGRSDDVGNHPPLFRPEPAHRQIGQSRLTFCPCQAPIPAAHQSGAEDDRTRFERSTGAGSPHQRPSRATQVRQRRPPPGRAPRARGSPAG